jgi:hypothetical protein
MNSRLPLPACDAPLLAFLFLICITPMSAGAGQVTFFAPPTYAGSGATQFVADFNGDGKPDILTSDGTLNLGKGDGTFTAGTAVMGGALAVADFNGDGKPDVLQQGTGTLLVLLGNGDGTFRPPISTNSGASLYPIISGDVNGDGKADVLGLFNNNLVVYLAKSDGTFAAGVSYPVGNTGLANEEITLGDLNGDQKVDVAVSLAGDNVVGQEIVLLGNGDGTFQSGKASTGVYYPESVVAGDFNGDGKLDLAISSADSAPSPDVSILLGNGDGTFQPPRVAFSGLGILAAADLNGDGKLDLVFSGSIIEIYDGNGDGTFSNTRSYRGGGSLAIADFNLDGKLDIAAGDFILLNTGAGTFLGQVAVLLPVAASAAVLGDFDKNGTNDVAAISAKNASSLCILTNDGTGALTLAHIYMLQQPSFGIATADLNGDGNLDLILAGTDSNGSDWSYSVLLGNGDGTFQSPVFYQQNVSVGEVTFSIVIADFNNDHRPDVSISLGGSGSQSLVVLLGNGDGTFASPAYIFDGGASSLAVADFNGDGNLDIAAAGTLGLAMLHGKGDGTFQPAAFPYTNGLRGLLAADLNRDGKVDLVSFDLNSGGNRVLLGKGDGTFNALSPFGQSGSGALADINGDGNLDLLDLVAPAGFGGSSFLIYLGHGDGTFASSIDVMSFGHPQGAFMLIADMNGDGKPDAIFGEQSPDVFVLLNTTPAPTPDFYLGVASGSQSSQTINAGQQATFQLAITPSAGFSGTVSLSCNITPPETPAPTCTLPGSVNVAGGKAALLTVTVVTIAPGAAGSLSSANFPTGARLISLMLVVFAAGLLIVGTRRWPPALEAPMMVLALFAMTGCGGGGSGGSSSLHVATGTPAGPYTVTVTATSSSLSHQMTLTVVVQ